MITMLLYMIIVIIAFVFGITISNTIRKEAGVIGTLRASGYTRKELIGHYMALPVIVTLIGAVIGNILGYTALKNVCAGMYYGSYSLPTYVTVWNAEAFWTDNGGSGADYAGSQLWSPSLQAEAFTAEISEKRSFWKAGGKEPVRLSPKLGDLPSVPTACDLPEYEQLHRTFYWNHICESAFVLWTFAAVSTFALSAGYPEQYACKIPVYAGGSGKCDERKQTGQYAGAFTVLLWNKDGK